MQHLRRSSLHLKVALIGLSDIHWSYNLAHFKQNWKLFKKLTSLNLYKTILSMYNLYKSLNDC